MAQLPEFDDMIEPIAIVGMSCRFPGEASSPEGLWQMMSNGRTGHSKIPADRFNAETWYHPNHDRRGAVNVKHGFFLKEDVSLFDAPFFSITAQEASGMDPMQRLLLEVSYETFENAGVPIDELIGSQTSVFCGCFTGDYDLLSNHDIFNHGPNAATGTGRAMLSNRVSWFFDLRGASFTIDTACSSSLYALHSACQSLRLKESKQALVTGSNLVLYPSMMHSLTNMHFLSPDGISHSFDDRANGYARGEAVGGIMLKPLGAAIADGDTIRAVIRGSGANQDGKTPGITMPSPHSQAELIRATYAQAGLDLAETGYFEAHGTGTALGDPMELSAIGATFGAARDAKQYPLYVGSVKTNIGHTEGCSGLAGVIKSVLCLERGLIPPNAGFETLNPKLRLEDWKLALPTQTMAWPSTGLRRVSVNSFGYGGSNAHAIIDDAYHYMKSRNLHGKHSTLVVEDSGSDSAVSLNGEDSTTLETQNATTPKNKLFVFSSQDQGGLQRTASSFRQFLDNELDAKTISSLQNDVEQETYLDDLCFTLAKRRTRFDYRSFAVANETGELATSLAKGLPKLKRASKHDNIIFIFTGQGAQWPQMGKQLLAIPIFRATMEQTHSYLSELGCSWDVFEELEKGSDSRIDSPEFSQPICTALQISLVELLRHWGVKPKATVGHSSGEIGAAYAAGYLSHRDAVKIAYFRGVYSADVSRRLENRPGLMMAAGVSEQDAREYLQHVPKDSAVVACVNSPSSVTLSGDESAINELETLLQRDNKFARKLRVTTAYHSPHMQVIAADYLKAMDNITPEHGNSTVMYSSVSGKLAVSSEFDATYWVRNMVGAVRFLDAVSGLLSHSQRSSSRRKSPVNWSAAIEVGPHEALKGPMNQIMAHVDAKLSSNIVYSSMVLRGKDAEITALEAAGQLWCSGHSVDLAKINDQDDKLRDTKVLSHLPSYQWNHSKGFWHEPRMTTAKRFGTEPRTDLLGAPLDNQNTLNPHWRNILRIPENPWMEHHEITGTILYPGAGILIMAIEAARKLADPSKTLKGIELQDVSFDRGLVIPSADEAVETSINLRPHKSFLDCYSWTVYSLPPGGTWVEHSSGLVSLIYKSQSGTLEDIGADFQYQTATYQKIKESSTKDISIDKFYKNLAAIGMNYGPMFTNLADAASTPTTHQAHGSVVIPDTKSIMPHQYEYPHLIHPATLDAIFHLLFVGFTQGEPLKEASVPVSMERMFIAASCPQGAGSKYVGYTEAAKIGGRDAAGHLVLSDEEWSESKIVISNFAAREVSSSSADAGGGTSSDTESDEFKRTAVLQWKEDLNFMSKDIGQKFIKEQGSIDQTFQSLEESYAQLGVWLDRACHKDADLRTMFVVDGVSSDMLEILRSFSPRARQTLRLQECTIATKEEGLRDEMKQQLVHNNLSIKYQQLDLANSSLEQNFQPKMFDIIVVQSTMDIQHTASNLKPLLSQDGKLVFNGNQCSSLKGEMAWSAALENASIEKPALFLENKDSVFVVASSGGLGHSKIDFDEIVLLRRETVSTALQLALQKLSARLEQRGFKVKVSTLMEADEFRGKPVISFLEAEDALVINWSSGELEHFKQIALSTPYMIWITRGGQMIESEAVDFAVATGMLRTVRTEVPQITLPHIDLSPTIDIEADSTCDLILNIFNSTACETEQTPEMEYVETSGKIMIPRVVESKSFDHELQLHSNNVPLVQAPLNQPGRPLKLEAGAAAGVNSIRWVNDESASGPELGPEEVEIKTSAVSLTALDVRAISGQGQGSIVGREAVGVISKVGSTVSRFAPGQRVAVLKSHSYRTHIRQHQSLVQQLPAGHAPEDLAALPTIFSVAYYAIVQLARLSTKDKILIQSGHSSLGQAAIQLAKWIGAEVYTTTGSEAKRDLLIKTYDIAADHIFDEEIRNFHPRLQRATGGSGVDVIFSAATGKSLKELGTLVKDFGRFVNVGSNVGVDSNLFKHNISFTHLDLEHFFNDTNPLAGDLMERTFDLLQAGVVRPVLPRNSFPLSEINSVFAKVQSEELDGSTVLNFDDSAMVPSVPPKPPQLKLDSTATFVLAGGLGGLGPNIAQTMYDAGARHLVFLSRSGASTPEQQAVLQKLEAQGCKAEALRCDISDAAQVSHIMHLASKHEWRIKGLVQCAMVLRDSVLENMTYDKWLGATQPKIAGTWNLHSLLPQDMDFFIMLSSVVSIIKNTGQANYAANNSYLDALAHFRRNRGLAATSLNVGLVSDATHFTEDFGVEDFLALYGHLMPVQVADKEVNIALEAAMRGSTAEGVPIPPQVVVGIRGDLEREGTVTSLWPKDRKFDHRVQETGGVAADAGKNLLKNLLTAATSIKEAAEAVEYALKSNVATSMGSLPEDVDGEKPLHAFGIDSLKAVEVRNWVFRELKADISVFEILSPTPLSKLSVKIAAKSKFIGPEISKQAEEDVNQD